jgi:hypothetical protein
MANAGPITGRIVGESADPAGLLCLRSQAELAPFAKPEGNGGKISRLRAPEGIRAEKTGGVASSSPLPYKKRL